MASTESAAPLLVSFSDTIENEKDERIGNAYAPGAVFNVINSIVGAGIMALPATQRELGVFLGILMVIVIGFLTDASVEMLTRFSCGRTSYSGAMAYSFGPIGRTMVQLCVIVNNFGYLIVYMIIIGDVLSGTSKGRVHHTGVLEEWGGGSYWWNERIFVLLVTTILLVVLVSYNQVDSLKHSSAVSVGLAMVFVMITAAITMVKLTRGTVEPPRLLPDVKDVFSFWKLFTAVPIIVTAFICHHNVHLIANELHPSVSIEKVCRISISICTLVFITMGMFGYLLFGESTMDDVLSNFDTDLGVPYGRALAAIVRLGYALHLMLVFPLIHFSLRDNVDKLLFPNSRPLSEDYRRFALITVVNIVLVFVGATIIPSIWTAFQFTGATAGICVGFIFPGLLVLRDRDGTARDKDKTLAWIMVILAVVSSISAIITNIYSLLLKS